MVYKYDFLVIGAGVAGMSYALKVARAQKGKVCMICKTSLDEANTSFAQGGEFRQAYRGHDDRR